MTVSIVMLTCNNFAKATHCLPSWSFALDDDRVVEWLILDNASTNRELLKWLRAFADRTGDKVTIIESDENLGCAGGRDMLYRMAKGDVILSLDSDVVALDESPIDILLNALDHPGVGIVGDHGCWVRPDWSWTTNTPDGYSGEAFAISGYCQCFRKDLLNNVALDLRFNPYWLEDTDFCAQIKHETGQIAYVTPCNIKHQWSKTNGNNRADRLAKWQHLANKWHDKFQPDEVFRPPGI
ncbi:glycosyltransferase [Planctomycetales bacterium ZRK34]|nr:glycosyltransferase [Planctomycetales bacterium ZRK34]